MVKGTNISNVLSQAANMFIRYLTKNPLPGTSKMNHIVFADAMQPW